ncbi:ShlB/FhaC/HecB family hemolysin secretion/activation protein [Massilia sp. DWR3-1-1]|uniref:ShlB/FhaC/HecB family hemolysin secretion/activation protein n=1 Tax=Massilia sp. DWR3-1-1 TaxID=2804559 RepID=UPI003CEE3055
MKNHYHVLPFLLIAGAASAQVTPDAGALQQQIDTSRQSSLPKAAPQQLAATPAPLERLAGPTVSVSAFRFVGNSVITQAQLEALLRPYLNRPLSFAELQAAAQAVSGAYREAGWIARAYLPRQEIDSGVVTIQIVEALFGGVRTDGAGRIDPRQAVAIVERAQRVGGLLNADALDRAILLVDDLPGVGASGNLAVGAREGETLLALRLTGETLLVGDAALDNTGSRSTGAIRASVNLAVNSPLRLGDAGAINLIHTDGSDYLRGAYTLALGSAGWRAGVNASTLRYRLVADEFAALRARGSADSAGVDASYPLLRSRLANIFLQLNGDSKRYDNQANGAVSSHYRLDSLGVGLNGNRYDEFGGGGATSANLALVRGDVKLGGSPNQASDAASTRSGGRFGKLRFGLSRQQALSESFSAAASLAGQYASKNLDSSEKFYLGGLYGVRAYPASEAGGSKGVLLNLELRARLPGAVSLAGFYDHGHVTVNRDNNFAGAAQVNGYALKGAGLALAWTAPFKVSLKAVWARRIGSNPSPNLNGSDQDGSLRRDRFWLQASVPF